MQQNYDVIIIGGGPAGLSAALLLGRARRQVLVCDEGNHRNRKSKHLHNFISRDGLSPKEFLDLARQDALRYPTVHLSQSRVLDAEHLGDSFSIKTENDETLHCKKLLLATGVIDELPPIPGIDQFFGTSVFHCPYCDAFEFSNRELFAYGSSECGRKIALELFGWSDRVTLITDGYSKLSEEQVENLVSAGTRIIETPLAKLNGQHGKLDSITFTNGRIEPADAIFFDTEYFQKSLLAEKLGCELDARGLFSTDKFESTHIPGLFIAGDASNVLHMVVTAAAAGVEAGYAINTQLLKESLAARRQRFRRSA